MPAITRRELVLGAIFTLTGMPTVSSHWPSLRTVGRWVRGLFSDAALAAHLGAVYLEGRPEERSAARLAEALFGSELSQQLDRAALDRLTRRLRAGRARDFHNDDLVVVGGWVLTRTEARLLGLVSLSRDLSV